MTIGKIENWSDIRELVLMSIGTDKGRWWAYPEFGSELWQLRQTGKVDGNTAGTVRQMILDSLQWLIDDGLAKEIECEAEQADKNRINYRVKVTRPNGSDILVEDIWNGIY